MIEESIEKLYEALFPKDASGARAVKPLLAPCLGCLLVDDVFRQLVRRRKYHTVNWQAFETFAMESRRSAHLEDFQDGEAVFFKRGSDSDQLIDESPDFRTAFSINGAAIARKQMFVSVTMEFCGEAQMMVTMTFAPTKVHQAIGDQAMLEEWDRYTIFQPIAGDEEWRFVMSGTYTDQLLLEHAATVQSGTAEQIESIRSHGIQNSTEFAQLFDLARTGLLLPSFLRTSGNAR